MSEIWFQRRAKYGHLGIEASGKLCGRKSGIAIHASMRFPLKSSLDRKRCRVGRCNAVWCQGTRQGFPLRQRGSRQVRSGATFGTYWSTLTRNSRVWTTYSVGVVGDISQRVVSMSSLKLLPGRTFSLHERRLVVVHVILCPPSHIHCLSWQEMAWPLKGLASE